MRPLHPAAGEIGQTVFIQIGDDHLPSDPRIVVGPVGNPVDAILAADEAEPVDDCAGVPHRALRVVRPVGFAGDDVLEAVAIDIGQVHRMQFAEDEAIRVLRGAVSHDQVLAEDNLVAIAKLFVPGEAEVVSREAGDHVVIAVAIDVVSIHLGPARPGEANLVQRPERIARQVRRLLEPAVLRDQIDPPVAVDIADPQAMAKRHRGDLFRERVKRPLGKGLVWIGRCIAEETFPRADQLRLLVAHEVHPLRRLVRDRVEHLVLGPGFIVPCRAGILVDETRRPRKTGGEDIPQAVAIKVVNPGEKVIGIALPRLSLGGINLAFRREFRPREPVGSIDDVGMAVGIQIARRDSLGVIDVGKLLALECVDGGLGSAR